MPVNIVPTTLKESGLAAISTNAKKINAPKAALEAMGAKAAANLSGKGLAHTETLAALTADSFTKIAG